MSGSGVTGGQPALETPGLASASRTPTRRAQLRAAVIAFLVLFNALAALPRPGEPSAERLQRPFEQEELRRWAGLLRGVGIDTDRERLARSYLSFSRSVERARAIALAPIEGWMTLTQTGQHWQLFGTPGRSVSALRVTVHSATGDEVLYESGDGARRWNAGFFEYRRIRANYRPSRRGPPPPYAAFGQRLSEHIFSTLPQVQRVTIAFVRYRVRLPDEAPPAAGADERRVEHVLEFERPEA